ncbi:MAG: hypothetical protein K8T90_04670 [Planctomycetes bacterium]|nr:hypothetical protein [Planctomycetota bacterium]
MQDDPEGDTTDVVWHSFRDSILARPDYVEYWNREVADAFAAWAGSWPGDVEDAWCNDIGCASSNVWLICHRREDGTNTAVTMVHVPQCHGSTWKPCRLPLEHVAHLLRWFRVPPGAVERREIERSYTVASVRVARRLRVGWVWRPDGGLNSASVSLEEAHGPGTPICFYPAHIPGWIAALERTLAPRDASTRAPRP